MKIVPKAPTVKKSFIAADKRGFSLSPRASRSAAKQAIEEGIPVAETVKSKQYIGYAIWYRPSP